MGDEKSKMSEAEAIEKVFETVYPDAIQPAAKEFGKALKPAGRELGKAAVTITQAINLALVPVALAVAGSKKLRKLMNGVRKELARRFESKRDRLITPKTYVAAPALAALRLTGDEPDLRALYVNLLETAMDAATAKIAHPKFVEVIRQLSPDEAKVLRLLATKKQFSLDGAALVNDIGRPAGCEYLDLMQSYIDNLRSLGLLWKQEFAIHVGGPLTAPPFAASLTSFGRQFCAACVLPIEP